MLNAVIFDLDGTLVDSERLWTEVTQELVESFGKAYDPEWQKEILGAGSLVAMTRTKERFDLPAELDELIALNAELFDRKIKVKLPEKKPGADALMLSLREAGIPYALATSGNRPMVEFVLNGHGWAEHFSAVVTLEDVTAAKPSPEVYQEAARRLGHEPHTCVAFEDAGAGVKSAKAAGCKVIGLTNPVAGEALDEADHCIVSFEEVVLDDLRKLI